jgi:hypothetical protein
MPRLSSSVSMALTPDPIGVLKIRPLKQAAGPSAATSPPPRPAVEPVRWGIPYRLHGGHMSVPFHLG